MVADFPFLTKRKTQRTVHGSVKIIARPKVGPIQGFVTSLSVVGVVTISKFKELDARGASRSSRLFCGSWTLGSKGRQFQYRPHNRLQNWLQTNEQTELSIIR
jgi:hypothetical protein